MKVSVFWTDASPAFHDMRDYYESLQGISPEMSADDIFMELSNLERVWRKRRISNPEKASEMLQIIEEAKEVFDSDETKSEYDRQLDLFKHPEQKQLVQEKDPEEERRRLLWEGNNVVLSLYESGQYMLAREAFEKYVAYTDDTVISAYFFYLGNAVYAQLDDIHRALDCYNKAVFLEPDNYKYRNCQLLALACLASDDGREGKNNPFYRQIAASVGTAFELLKKPGNKQEKARLSGWYAEQICLYEGDDLEARKEAEKYAKAGAYLGDDTGTSQRVLAAIREQQEMDAWMKELEEKTEEFKKKKSRFW